MREKKIFEQIRCKEKKVLVWGLGWVYDSAGKIIFEKLGIEIDYYYDRYNQTKLIENNKRVESIRDIENPENTVCIVLIGNAYDLESIFTELKEAGFSHVISFNDLCSYGEIQRIAFPNIRKERVAVYTCITDQYDEVREPKVVEDNCDYYLISDKRPEGNSIYKYIDINSVVPSGLPDGITKNRYCKMHPDIIFKNYRYTVYIDGNMQITSKMTPLIYKTLTYGLCVSTVHNEDYLTHATKIFFEGYDDREIISKQINRYIEEGFPTNGYVYLCSCIITDNCDNRATELLHEWWDEYKKSCRRDQLSFSYVLWKHKIQRLEIAYGDYEYKDYKYINDSPYWNYVYNHKKRFVNQVIRSE